MPRKPKSEPWVPLPLSKLTPMPLTRGQEAMVRVRSAGALERCACGSGKPQRTLMIDGSRARWACEDCKDE